MDWLKEHYWETWLGLGLLLAVAEMMSMDLILLMLAAGAFAGVLCALLGLPLLAQVLTASVVATGMLGLVRPRILKRFYDTPEYVTGHDKLVGHQAVVTEALTFDAPGRIKLAGEIWSATPTTREETIEVGTTVRVTRIAGAIAHVETITQESSPAA